MNEKIICIGIISIFLLTSLTSLSAVGIKATDTGDTIYVDDDGGVDYIDIQDAINAANPDDTIFVYSGTYSRFTVNKQLTIIGEERTNTIVHGNLIKLHADGINLETFTLKGKSLGLDSVLEIRGDSCSISNCNIYPTEGIKPLYGVDIGWCHDITLSNCEITGFNYRDIQFKDAHHCYIEDCIISDSYKGIETMFDGTHHIYICNSEIFNCGWDDYEPSSGIELSAHNNLISNCNFHDNYHGVNIYAAKYNQITNCNFNNNENGLTLRGYYGGSWGSYEYSEENYIISNDFSNNQIGVRIDQYCRNNYIHHNNFLTNSENAKDSGTDNNWDEPAEGNYWDDYTGTDTNNDGIGDTPYNIPNNGIDNYPFINQIPPDNHPPSKPTLDGPITGMQGATIIFSANSVDPNYDNIFYLFDWGDGTNSNWIGPFGFEETGSISHIWETSGTFNVKVKAKDIYGEESSWSNSLQINIIENSNPTILQLTGPSEGIVGYSISFSVSSCDSDGDKVRYYFDWGDKTSTWTDYYEQGSEVTISYIWGEFRKFSSNKTFEIIVKVQDIHGAESEFSSMLVLITNNPPGNTIIINAPDTGKIKEKYQITVSSEDSDLHVICFEIDWGNSRVFTNDYIESGGQTTLATTYFNKGDYTIKVRAVDYYGAEGPWETFTVNISSKKAINRPILRILENFPFIFHLLQHVLKL